MICRDFMQRPGPSSAPVRFTIVRDVTSCKGQPIYSLYLDDPAKLILAAQKRRKSQASVYTISLDNQVLASLLAFRIIVMLQKAMLLSFVSYACGILGLQILKMKLVSIHIEGVSLVLNIILTNSNGVLLTLLFTY